MKIFKKIASAYFSFLIMAALAALFLIGGALDANALTFTDVFKYGGAVLALAIVGVIGFNICDGEKK